MRRLVLWWLVAVMLLALALAAPQVTINSPSNTTLTSQIIVFNASLNESGFVWFNLNDGTNISMNTTDNLSFSYTNNSVSDGSYTAFFFANNTNGSLNNSESVSFIVDTVVNYTVLSPVANQSFNSSQVVFNVSGAEFLNTVTINISGALRNLSTLDNATWSFVNSSNIPGNYSVQFTVSDSFGNSEITEINYSVDYFIDTTNPQVNITSPAAGFQGSNITFSFISDEDIDSGLFNLAGTNYTMSTSDNRTFTYTNSSVIDGNYTVTFFANDTAGNRNDSESVFIAVDTTAPVLNLSSFPANNSVVSNLSIILFSVDDLNLVSTNLTVNGNSFSVGQATGWYPFVNVSVSGVNVLSMTSVDAAGNLAFSGNYSYFVDVLPPQVNITGPSPGLQDPNVTFSFVSSENVHVAYFELGGRNYNMSTSDNRTFTYTNSSVIDGNYTVTFFVNDSVGNRNDSQTVDIAVDTIAPIINLSFPTNNSVITASQIFSFIINDTTLVATNFSINGNTSNVTGPNFVPFAGVSVTGVYVLSLTAIDAANNSAFSGNYSYTVDVTPLQVNITSPSPGLQDPNVTFSIIASEDVDTALFDLGGVNYTMSTSDNRTFTYTNSSVVDGNYTVTFYANDSVNNRNDSQTVNIAIDTTAPIITPSFPANNSFILPTQNFSFSISDTTLVSTNVSVNGSSSAVTNNFVPFSGVSQSGQYILSLTSIDAANNSAFSGNYTYNIDLSAPTMNVSVVSANTPSNFSINLTDNGALNTLWYDFNGIENRTINASINSSSLLTNLYDEIFPGVHNLIFYANDSVGNTVNQSVNVQITGPVNFTEEKVSILLPVDNATGQFYYENASSIEGAFNSTNITNVTFSINLNQSQEIQINFSGVDSSAVFWQQNFTNITDNDTTLTGQVSSQFSSTVLASLSLQGQSRVFPNGSYDLITAQFDNFAFDALYYFVEDINFDNKSDVLLCEGGNYTTGDTLPCFVQANNKTNVYLSSFSGLFFVNDTTPPTITVQAPNATEYVSEFTPTINVSLDTANCTMYYNNTNVTSAGTLDNSAGTCTFSAISITDGENGTVNFTATDTSNNSASSIVSFNISDTTNPIPTITSPTNGSTVTTSSVSLSVSVNERSTVTRSYNGGSFVSCFSNALSGSCTISGMSDGTRSITINVTDLSNNSMLQTISIVVNIPDDDDDDNGGGSGGGSSSGSTSSSSSFSPSDYKDDDEQEEQEEIPINTSPRNYETTLIQEEEFILRVNDSVTVPINGDDITFLFIEFDDVTKTAVFDLGDRQISVGMASPLEFDIDGDGNYDAFVTLKNLAAQRAYLVVSEPLVEDLQVEQEEIEEEEVQEPSFPLIPVIIASVVILIILGVIIFIKHKKPPVEPVVPKDYAPHEGPQTEEFSANKHLKERNSQTKGFSPNKYLKK